VSSFNAHAPSSHLSQRLPVNPPSAPKGTPLRIFYFKGALLLGFFLTLFLPACASTNHQRQMEHDLLSHRYLEADAAVEKNQKQYGDRNVVLYYLDRAMLLHLGRRYEESNLFFEKADSEIERLYTQSISTHAGAFLTNDNLLPYEGEDFEKVLIHLFSALNYAGLTQWDDALVEARQVDARLNLLNDRHGQKNIYKEDASARYLAGILYETRGEVNDAFISYRKAYEAFQDYKKFYQTPIPSRMGFDLLRLSSVLRLPEEQAEYQQAFPQAVSLLSSSLPQDAGEMVVVGYTGRSPVKEDYFVDAPVPDGNGGVYLARVAFPRFVSRPSQIEFVEATFRRGETVLSQRLELLEDITAIAKKNLEDHVARISAKAIGRAATKYLATRTAKNQAKKKGGEQAEALAGFLGNLYSIVTEESDKRSWQTLPGKIHLGRILLPEGEWEGQIKYYGPHGALIEERRFPDLKVKKGAKRFLIDQTLR
jgi:hypothetical protein